MADAKQLEILKLGVEGWNEWRKDNPATKIDLSKAELLRINLSQANLWSADLRGVDLREADLTRANLWNADLSRADLKRACLVAANLNQANFTKADLSQADLSQANLKRAFLAEANLSEANLTKADLFKTHLSQANLFKANLSQGDFNGSHLSQANLSEANLTKTDLSQADLTKADLRGTLLSGTILNRTKLGYTTIGDTDLSECIGLETIVHLIASTVGTDTIRKSKGKIPVKFFRGCGLSDLEIAYAKLATRGLDSEQVTQITYEIYRLYCDQPIQFYSCFISYSSKDEKFAQRLYNDLQNSGVRCWFAPEDLKIGDEFRRTIGQQIRFRDKLLIILSNNSIGSEWVGDEVERALAEEKDQGILKLFPIRLDNGVLETKDDWAEKIRLRRHIGDFSAWSDESLYNSAFERLLKDLKIS